MRRAPNVTCCVTRRQALRSTGVGIPPRCRLRTACAVCPICARSGMRWVPASWWAHRSKPRLILRATCSSSNSSSPRCAASARLSRTTRRRFPPSRQARRELTCYLLSIIRLIKPNVLLPATTALGTIVPDGRERGILAGANVVMPNLSPVNRRKDYDLYDNKICTGEEAAECRGCLGARMLSIGYELVVDRGDMAPCPRRDSRRAIKRIEERRTLWGIRITRNRSAPMSSSTTRRSWRRSPSPTRIRTTCSCATTFWRSASPTCTRQASTAP